MATLAGTTARLRLRQWTERDREPYAALNGDPEVMRYFPAPYAPEESHAQLERMRAQIEAHGFGFMAVERLDSGDLIGFVGLNRPSYELPMGPCVEIGWRLAKAHWGLGFATEAAQHCVRFGFEDLKLEEIVSFTSLWNRPSIAVMERLGMRRDAETFRHPKVPATSELAEHCLYRIQPEARPWPGRA